MNAETQKLHDRIARLEAALDRAQAVGNTQLKLCGEAAGMLPTETCYGAVLRVVAERNALRGITPTPDVAPPLGRLAAVGTLDLKIQNNPTIWRKPMNPPCFMMARRVRENNP